MPRKVRRAKARTLPLTPVQRAFLLGLPLPEDRDPAEDWWLFEASAMNGTDPSRAEDARSMWERHKAELMADWIAEWPGTRPDAWWWYEAPREPVGTHPGVWYDGTFAEPRRRLGGTGTPRFEVLAEVPQYERGVPTSWITAEEVELYSGRARDVNGKVLFPEWRKRPFPGVAVDPADPPLYEAEAAYLTRHNLLLPGEERRLSAADLEPVPVAIDD